MEKHQIPCLLLLTKSNLIKALPKIVLWQGLQLINVTTVNSQAYWSLLEDNGEHGLWEPLKFIGHLLTTLRLCATNLCTRESYFFIVCHISKIRRFSPLTTFRIWIEFSHASLSIQMMSVGNVIDITGLLLLWTALTRQHSFYGIKTTLHLLLQPKMVNSNSFCSSA